MSKRLPRKLRIALRIAFLLFLLAGTIIGGLSCVWRHEYYNGGTSAPQDPETGIMEGAEPITIDAGRDRAALLLHGWLTTPADFAGLPEALDEAGWDVYAPLLPGHGRHPRDLVGLTADEVQDAARDRYDELRERYDTVALVGFSIGGTTSALVALERQPAALVLVAPFVKVRHKWYYLLPARFWHVVLSPVVPYIGRGRGVVRVNRKEALDRLRTYTAFPSRSTDVVFDLGDRLKDADLSRLDVPTLLLLAPGDEVASPAAARKVCDRIPAASRETFAAEEANHHILSDYGREDAVARIVGFLEEAINR